MRNKEETIKNINDFINSDEKHCMVIGTNVQEKHKDIIRFLNSLGMNLKLLIRLNTLQDSEYILGFKSKTGISKKIGNLTIYVDSMQSKSHEKTHKNFNCVLIYPIASLKGISDNNIDDILHCRSSEKIFWISNHDNVDYSYLKSICNIKIIIEINNDDDVIHNRILNNQTITKEDSFDKLYIENLSYNSVERAINVQYNLGGIYTSSMGQALIQGSFGEYIFGGNKSTKRVCVKVLEDKSNEKYVLLTKLCK